MVTQRALWKETMDEMSTVDARVADLFKRLQ